jgi:hypothetical protein
MLDTGSSSLAQARIRAPAALAYNLAGITVLVLLLAIGAAYLLDELANNDQAALPALTDNDAIQQTLSGHELTIPSSWFRYGEQIRNGFTDQVDLRIVLDLAGDMPLAPVNVTLLPRSRARTSASLLDRVYLHQFGEETLSGAPGLVGKPMLLTGGYRGESVWYDALTPDPFVAKCMGDIEGMGEQQCVRTVYLPSGIAAVYTFDAKLLPAWRQFDVEAERWLSRIGAW